MKRLNFKLQTKIMMMATILVLISISLLAFLIIKWSMNNTQKKVEVNILNLATAVANVPSISKDIERKDPDRNIQQYVGSVLKSVNDVEIIVVADMEGIRYAHPDADKLGKRFVGGDEKRVLETGDSYVAEATGTMGKALRAFVPIYDERHRQVGFVMVGELVKTLGEAKHQVMVTVIYLSAFSLFLGGIGAFILARNIKKALLGLEPEEIANLYIEKKAILNAIRDGIIAVDQNRRITLVNDAAMDILNIRNMDVKELIGKNVVDVLPTTRLDKVLEAGIPEYDREQKINGTVIMTTRVPIKDGNKVVGAIATFRDKTMVTRMAEEITGVKQIIEAMRANTHEFANKLHVVLGLIQVGEIEEAKKYILHVTEAQQQILSMVMNKVKDPTIAGLILGKLSRAKELGVKFVIDKDTQLDSVHGSIRSDVLITIIGNVLENAFEAVNKNKNESKEVHFKLQESDEALEIDVKDTGIGIPEEDIKKIFTKGFTTNSGNRGVGLSLVKDTVTSLNGRMEVASQVGKGTRFRIILPKTAQNDVVDC